ncbi:MAG: hypothetical protein KFW07_03880 [Mycoplasmataceae bacterium]|nr:hypothetical protein [Mycoplasmataceae bacterium]
MIKIQHKKQIYYEVNPLFFYDSNDDGFGDFAGLSKKIDYFSFMGVNCIIIPDIFNNYNSLLFSKFINLKNKYGNIKELREMIEIIGKKKINFAVEVNIKDIKKSLLFSSDGSINEGDFGQSKKAFFLAKNQSENQSENWNSRKTLESFDKIIRFWISLGVMNFVFTDFEYLFNKNEVFSSITKDQLNQLYEIVNKINPLITIILKSPLLTQKNINDCLNQEAQAADLFIDSSYSLLGTNPKTNNDKIEKFKPIKMISRIKAAHLISDMNNNIIMSLGSGASGRINSRWGSEGSLNSLAAKALMAISLMSANSSLIYYGDELGVLKTNIKNMSDFNDINLVERRRNLQSQGQSEIDFNTAQQYLSPINTQSLFQWDLSKNGGFSKSDTIVRQTSSTYKEINVANQYMDLDSPLTYSKKLIELIKSPLYAHFFNESITKVSAISREVIKYQHKFGDEKLFIFINISRKWKKVNISNNLGVIMSNYTNKKYQNKIKMLGPFESIVLFSKKDQL